MKKRNLKLFYLHELLFQFSDTMLALVLPVFLYETFHSLSAVFLFIMAWNIIHGALYIPVFNLAMRWKRPKFFMMTGIVFYIMSLSLFSLTTPQSKWLIIPGVCIYSLYISFYWMIRHWFINVNSDHTVIGKQMSIIYLIRTLITFIAPIVGGAVSFLVSFNASFLVGVLAGTISLVPIALFNAPPHPEKYSLKKMIATLKKKEIKAVSPGYFWEGICSISVINVWILIFAIYIGNILDLGLLVGFTTLATGMIIWLTGMWFDKRSRTKLLTHLTKIRMLTVMAYTTVYFFPHIAYVWLIEFLNRLAYTAQNTVLDSYLYAYGNKINPVEFSLSREFYLNISRFSASAVLAVIFYFLPAIYLWPVLFFGSFAVLGLIYAKRNDHHLA